MQILKNLFKQPEEGAGSLDFVWCRVNPTRSYVSVTEVSTDPNPPWPAGFRLVGATLEHNESLPILGRGIDWEMFNEKEREQIKTRAYSMTLGKFKSLMRR